MFLLLLLIWILFNGQLTLEIFLFGLVFASLIYAFICRFFGFSFKKDIMLIKLSGYIIEYLLVLFIEIVKANLVTGKHLLSERYEVEPVLVTFTTALRTETARVVLANYAYSGNNNRKAK